jgi:hypothetical protein
LERSGSGGYYEAHRAEMLAYAKRYYEAHRAEMLAYAKRYYEAHRAERLAYHKRCRLRKIDEYRAKELVNFKRWREVNFDKHKAIKFARNHFSLGVGCEFCGSKVGLMRFLVEYKVPVDFVVTVCSFCRGYARKSLKELDI